MTLHVLSASYQAAISMLGLACVLVGELIRKTGMVGVCFGTVHGGDGCRASETCTACTHAVPAALRECCRKCVGGWVLTVCMCHAYQLACRGCGHAVHSHLASALKFFYCDICSCYGSGRLDLGEVLSTVFIGNGWPVDAACCHQQRARAMRSSRQRAASRTSSGAHMSPSTSSSRGGYTGRR